MKTPLTPTQRALISSILLSALVAGGVAIEPVLTATGPTNWQAVAMTFVIVAIVNAAHHVIVLMQPSQPALADEFETLLSLVEKRYGLTPVHQAQNSPTMTVARPQATGYPNISMNPQPVPTPTVAGNVWGMPGQDVSAMNTASVPVQPK